MTTLPEIGQGRHLSCHSSVDETVLAKLDAWRQEEAQRQNMPAFVILTSQAMRAIAEAKPQSVEELVNLGLLPRIKSTRYAAQIVEAIHATQPQV